VELVEVVHLRSFQISNISANKLNKISESKENKTLFRTQIPLTILKISITIIAKIREEEDL
jgi:hypothetical protein